MSLLWCWKPSLTRAPGYGTRFLVYSNGLIMPRQSYVLDLLLMKKSIAGVPGSNNDINVNDRSPMWADIAGGVFPRATYELGKRSFEQLYFTADNIYPRYPIFMQSFGASYDPKEAYFSKRIESVRKDVERAFGILQSRFATLRKPSLFWSFEDLQNEVLCCIILHNMILEDERGDNEVTSTSLLPQQASLGKQTKQYPLDAIISNLQNSQSLNKFLNLRESLADHLYGTRGTWN